MARAKYIQGSGTRGEHPFKPNQQQLKFYAYLDSCLLNRHRSHRPVSQHFDIMHVFAQLLKTVLSERQYRKWRSRAFRGVTDAMADTFVRYIDEPERIVHDLKAAGRNPLIIAHQGLPVFNRSLAYQATAMYPPRSAKAMQDLVQTTFYAPFASRERAVGRYSRYLRELVWVPPGDQPLEAEGESIDNIVSVEANIDVLVGLPDLSTDFADAIAAVRESNAGISLRHSVRQIGSEQTFRSQESAWMGVADLLASRVNRAKPVSLRTTLLRVGKDVVCGTLAYGILSPVLELDKVIPGVLGEALLGGTIGVAFDHGYKILRADLQRQKLRSQIERAVQFRCTQVEIPTVADGQGDHGEDAPG